MADRWAVPAGGHYLPARFLAVVLLAFRPRCCSLSRSFGSLRQFGVALAWFGLGGDLPATGFAGVAGKGLKGNGSLFLHSVI